MAVVDANLNFISIDVGAYGREADPSVFRESVFGQKLYSNLLQIPEPRALPSSENNIQPFVFVADEAFGFHTNVMRPFPGRDLNILGVYLITDYLEQEEQLNVRSGYL